MPITYRNLRDFIEEQIKRVNIRAIPRNAAHSDKDLVANNPWNVMSPEDRKEAFRLWGKSMKAMSGSPRQREAQEKLFAILDKYGIGKK